MSFGVLLVVGLIGGSLVPVIPITYAVKEPYQRTEKYTENVPVEVEVPVQYQEIELVPVQVAVPYQETVNQRDNLFSVSSTTLEPRKYLYRVAQLPAGRDVQFTFRASDAVNIFVFSSGQFANYQQSRASSPLAQLQPEVSLILLVMVVKANM
ncbi:MAG: hypothetical protein FJ358_06195 [Thaumarchaeota archaeon]|nr:hypothetical protein [Nitrososphaerota archaeon]